VHLVLQQSSFWMVHRITDDSSMLIICARSMLLARIMPLMLNDE
jgi:hypothetical protein